MKKKKSKQTSKSLVDFDDFNRYSSIPTCPQCGNQEMNYYVSAEGKWKCSKAHLHINPKFSLSSFKTVA